MYRALEIARYAINYINIHEKNISNLKLQKILYYIQAAFLIELEEVCFSDAIICWQHGPVVKIVYNEFKIYGADSIPIQKDITKLVFKDGIFKFERIPYSDEQIDSGHKKLLNAVLDGLMPYDAWFLVERTHEEAPWKDLNNHYNSEIYPEKIKTYFEDKNNKERIYGNFPK